MANARKRAQISGRYQPYPITPTTRKTMVNMSIVRMNILTEFLRAAKDATAKSPVAPHKSHGAAISDCPTLMTQSEA